jgi:hypothetical protein
MEKQNHKIMLTIFIFTHLITVSTALLILYNVYGIEADESGRFPSNDSIWVNLLLNKFKALGCNMKERCILISSRILKLKIQNRPKRRWGPTKQFSIIKIKKNEKVKYKY